ncbi:hypothetical protein K2173_025015 [Erythroxylum novogranatense]|uniref:Uncharacterized protein n=1 Tax=Erythroxylum novogranatense TaxID=1862640 RepID=A0AAV8UD10_9ROSI|nr:hypothetical protein K2173_025015 [Erythroxylum novogranatense]
MKPESKKNGGNTDSSLHIHLKPKEKVSSSSFDLTKLSHALDLVDNKPVEEIVDNANSILKQSQSGSPFNLTQLSDALSVADEEEKKRAVFSSRFLGVPDIVKTDFGLFSVTCDTFSPIGGKDPGVWSFPGIPIGLRLARIVSIEKSRRLIKVRMPHRWARRR